MTGKTVFEPGDLFTRRRKIHLIRDLSAHLIITCLFAWIVYSLSGSLMYTAAAFLGGIFIDLDHLVDYFLRFGARLRLKDFFYGTAVCSGRVYIPFHTWELVFLILISSVVLHSFLLLVVFWGMTLHLIIDSVQRKNPRVYFLIYRLFKKFNADILLPETFEHGKSSPGNRYT